MRGWVLRVSGAAIAVFLVAACSKEPESTRKSPTPPTLHASAAPLDPVTEADRLFERRCQVCHGKQGKGDGPGSLTLEVKPRDYTDRGWQESTRDEQIRKIILEGGAAVGKDPGMPSTPELATQPKVVDALVAKIRSFAAK